MLKYIHIYAECALMILLLLTVLVPRLNTLHLSTANSPLWNVTLDGVRRKSGAGVY